MVLMRESKLEKQFKHDVRTFGFNTYSIHGKTSSDNGIPDVLCVWGETSIFFELKMEKNEVSIPQMKFLKSYKHSYMVKFIENEWICENYFDGVKVAKLVDILKFYKGK